MANKKQMMKEEKEHVEGELSKLLEKTFQLENELYAIQNAQ